MVDLRQEGQLGGLKGIVGGEVDVNLEHTSLVGRVGRAHDSALPCEEVIALGTGRDVRGGILLEIIDFLLNTTECHGLKLQVGA